MQNKVHFITKFFMLENIVISTKKMLFVLTCVMGGNVLPKMS